MIEFFGEETQTSTVSGFLVGVLTLGAALGAIIAPLLMKYFTRRYYIFIINCLEN
jgi:MFS-type transporter involved in bile tolerance (Atg22 family)